MTHIHDRLAPIEGVKRNPAVRYNHIVVIAFAVWPYGNPTRVITRMSIRQNYLGICTEFTFGFHQRMNRLAESALMCARY